MSTLKSYNGTEVQTDGEGFLLDAAGWDTDVAAGIAAEHGIPELTDGHWAVIRCVREAYAENRPTPPLRALSTKSGVSMKELHRMFPGGAVLAQVARISGGSKPSTCL